MYVLREGYDSSQKSEYADIEWIAIHDASVLFHNLNTNTLIVRHGTRITPVSKGGLVLTCPEE